MYEHLKCNDEDEEKKDYKKYEEKTDWNKEEKDTIGVKIEVGNAEQLLADLCKDKES